MELPHSLLCFLVFLVTFLLFLYMLIKILSQFSHTATARLPPGPWKLPIIGNLHQLKGSPHQSLRDLANRYGPIMHLRLGELRTTVLSSPEFAKQIFTTHDIIFANRPKTVASQILSYNFLDISFSPYGSYWKQLRKICKLELLSPKKIDSFKSIREEEMNGLVKELFSCQETKPIDLSKKLFSISSSIAMPAAFGKQSKEKHSTYLSIAYKIIKNNTGFTLVNLFPSFKVLEWISGARPKLEKLHKEKDKVVQEILDEHKQRRLEKRVLEDADFEDQIDVLLKIREEEDLEFPLTDDAIKAILWDMVTGAVETSSATMEWAMTELLRNPESMRQAQAEVRRVYGEKGNSIDVVDESKSQELHYLKAVVKETLRLHPPSPLLMPRESTEACEINGYDIPANTRVIINAWAIARDSTYWPEPEKFYPERFLDSSIDYKGMNFEYLPFGAGRRMCPGIYFAQANIELLLAKLLFHFDWKLPEGMTKEDIDMNESYGLAVSRKIGLVVIPIPYHPC